MTDVNIENEESQEESLESKDSEQETESGKTDEAKGEEKKTEADPKEQNRKGFEMRKAQAKTVSREEFDSLQKQVSETNEKNADLSFRNAHQNVSDDEFTQIKAQAKATGKGYEEVLEMPIFKDHFERKDAQARTSGATPAPSNRSGAGTSANFKNMSSEEFREYQSKVMNR